MAQFDAAEAGTIPEPAGAAPDWMRSVAPDAGQVGAIAAHALTRLPAGLASRFGGLPIAVLDLPEPERLERLGVEDPFDLIGQFEAEGADADPLDRPSRLVVFRRPLLDYWAERGAGLDQVLSEILLGEIEARLDADTLRSAAEAVAS